MLGEMPLGRRVRAFVEVEDESDRQTLSSPADAEVIWLYRQDGARLETAAASLDATDLPPGTVVWGGMEHAARRSVFRRAVDTWQLPRDCLRLASYWRRGQAGADHHHDD